MANLDLIKSLNNIYGKSSVIMQRSGSFSINESLNPDKIQKALSDSLADLGPKFIQYFDLGLPVDVVLLFIDVCNFSTRFSILKGEEIGKYFDQYYDNIIPTIYKYGGEIDKIIGDGIICIFGPPFQNLELIDNISKADKCSKQIIKSTKNSKFSSKVALHCGTINYFKNKSGLYNEFTIIGKPLTELFRLESISIEERINYYDDTDIKKYYQSRIKNSSAPSNPTEWLHSEKLITNLKGVNFKKFYSIKHIL